MGINAFDARFTVDELCLSSIYPCTSVISSTFKNLNYGVYLQCSNAADANARICNAVFDNNFRGVFLRSANNSVITHNSFNVDANVLEMAPVPFEHKAYGLYMESSTGFTVENNSFETSQNSWYGIVVHNLGKGNNRLYRNQFNGFLISTLSMGINGSTPVNQPFKPTGLLFKCNEFFKSGLTDIGISSGDVAYYQGLCSNDTRTPAGNRFLTSGVPPLGNIFTNNNVSTFTYYNHHPNPETTPSLYTGVKILTNICFATPFEQNNSCPLTTVAPPSQLIADINAYNIFLQTRISLLQNGDKENMLKAIHTNQAPGQVKNLLLSATPYLSDRVLLASINQKPTPLPHGILKEIIIPNSPVTDTVYNALLQRNPALPQGTMNNIQQVQTGE